MDANKIELFHSVVRAVHPNDEMFKIAKAQLPRVGEAFHYYFYTGGLLATRTRDYLLNRGVVTSNLSILDFACGYGRISRYFALIFKQLVCSDLEPEMLKFVEEQFGASTFLSAIEIDHIKTPVQRFDVVFSFSLFTHLNPTIWDKWFWFLYERVEMGGYFFITTRSMEFAKFKGEIILAGQNAQFTSKNETEGRLEPDIYGQTTISREFIVEVIRRGNMNIEYVDHFPLGTFDLYQDMHVFRKPIE